MVRRVYSHLGQVRHRADVVEYRVEQHFEQLGEQLPRLGFDTTNVATAEQGREKDKPRDHGSERGALDSDGWARPDSNRRPLAPEASALSN